jgi:hypothetical protein
MVTALSMSPPPLLLVEPSSDPASTSPLELPPLPVPDPPLVPDPLPELPLELLLALPPLVDAAPLLLVPPLVLTLPSTGVPSPELVGPFPPPQPTSASAGPSARTAMHTRWGRIRNSPRRRGACRPR